MHFKQFLNSLGRADVTLRHAKGKIAENTVYACALPSADGDTHGTKGKKEMISRMSDQANMYVPLLLIVCIVCVGGRDEVMEA